MQRVSFFTRVVVHFYSRNVCRRRQQDRYYFTQRLRITRSWCKKTNKKRFSGLCHQIQCSIISNNRKKKQQQRSNNEVFSTTPSIFHATYTRQLSKHLFRKVYSFNRTVFLKTKVTRTQVGITSTKFKLKLLRPTRQISKSKINLPIFEVLLERKFRSSQMRWKENPVMWKKSCSGSLGFSLRLKA